MGEKEEEEEQEVFFSRTETTEKSFQLKEKSVSNIKMRAIRG